MLSDNSSYNNIIDLSQDQDFNSIDSIMSIFLNQEEALSPRL